MITITPSDNGTDQFRYSEEYLLELLYTSGYEGRPRDELKREISDRENMTPERYNAILQNLMNSQLDRITSGFNYSATDIIKHLKKLR